MASKHDQGKSKAHFVSLKTFRKWNVADVIGIEKREIDGDVFVVRVYCIMCKNHEMEIKRDPKIRGIAVKDINKYIHGTPFVTKYTVKRHMESTAHQLAVYYNNLQGGTHQASSSEDHGARASGFGPQQPKINDAIHRQAEEAYRKLLKTAYTLAQSGQPISHFRTLVKVQKENGVRLIEGCESSHNAKEFISEIAEAIKEKLAVLLCSSSAFSILTDGSQARKTGCEKELILVRTVKSGLPTYYVIGLQDMDEYGDANANNLKKAIDDAFLNNLKIPQQKYLNLMVSATSDGASVNTGIYNGILTQFKQERVWLLTIHCVSHRTELALKDSLMKDPHFKKINDFMISLFYTFKRSGKLSREFKQYAERNNVQIYTFPKVHGTRFLDHQRNGVKVLLSNWIPLAHTLENAVASRGHKAMEPKLRGYLKQLNNFSFFSTACLYREILEMVTPVSLKFQESKLQVFDVHFEVKKTQNNLNDMLEDQEEELTLSHPNDDHVYALSEHILKCKLPKPNNRKKKPENREYTHLSMKVTHTGETTFTAIKNLKRNIIPQIVHCLETRFKSFDDKLYQNMHWINPAYWHENDEDLNAIFSLASHFETTLALKGFETDKKKLRREWRELKQTVAKFYTGFSCLDMWQRVIKYRGGEFPNLVKLVEIVLSIGPSNAFVENGFNILTSMLSDRRLLLKHKTMEDLFLIKANHAAWSEQEKAEIIESALSKHMSKKRKLTLTGGTDSAKRTKSVDSGSDFDTDSNSSGSSDSYDSEPEHENFEITEDTHKQSQSEPSDAENDMESNNKVEHNDSPEIDSGDNDELVSDDGSEKVSDANAHKISSHGELKSGDDELASDDSDTGELEPGDSDSDELESGDSDSDDQLVTDDDKHEGSSSDELTFEDFIDSDD